MRSFTRMMWEEAAAAVGASFSEPSPRLFEFAREGLAVHVLGQRTPFADPVSIELAETKDLAYALLTRAGVRVPAHIVVRPKRPPGRTLLPRDWPGARGRQTRPRRRGRPWRHALDRDDVSQLERALRRAAPGRAAHRRASGSRRAVPLPPARRRSCWTSSVATGRRSSATAPRRSRSSCSPNTTAASTTDTAEGMKPFPVDLDCLFTLERQGLSLSTRPPKGTTVVVKSASNISGGRTCVTVREPVAREVAARGASRSGRRRCAPGRRRRRRSGREEISRSTNGVVLEVNPIPGLGHHYNVAEPEAATPVAALVLEALFAQRAAAAEQA